VPPGLLVRLVDDWPPVADVSPPVPVLPVGTEVPADEHAATQSPTMLEKISN